jgi:hypothetical protein
MSDHYGSHHDEGSIEQGIDHAMNKASGKIGGGGGSDWMTGGIFALIFFLPILLAKIIGFIFALLSKIPYVGRVIQSVLVGIVFPIIAILLLTFSQGAIKEIHVPYFLSEFVQVFILFAVFLLPALWHLLWHGDVVKRISAFEYSNIIKTSFVICFIGYIISGIIGLISSAVFGGILTAGVTAFAFIVYFKNVKPYAEEAAQERKPSPLRPTVMLIGLGLVVLLSFIGATTASVDHAKRVAEDAAKEAQMIKENPKKAIMMKKTPFQANVTSAFIGIKPSMHGGTKVEIPAGSIVTVDGFGNALSDNYVVFITFKGEEIHADNVEYFEPIN